jgi:hypothetical protein
MESNRAKLAMGAGECAQRIACAEYQHFSQLDARGLVQGLLRHALAHYFERKPERFDGQALWKPQ